MSGWALAEWASVELEPCCSPLTNSQSRTDESDDPGLKRDLRIHCAKSLRCCSMVKEFTAKLLLGQAMSPARGRKPDWIRGCQFRRVGNGWNCTVTKTISAVM